jgi:diguanylate cyclase (GGDEF)-like protein
VSTVVLHIIFETIILTALIIYIFLYIKNKHFLNIKSIELEECRKNVSVLIRLRDSMFEISQAVVGIKSPIDLYNLILTKAIEAIPNANVGSVLIRDEDGLFRCAAQKGFDDEMTKNLSLPLEETILWKYTNGKILHTEIINDINTVDGLNLRPLTVDPEKWELNSSLSVPIFTKDSITGLVNIDSKYTNAFTIDDYKAMEYARSNIEAVLQKHALFSKILTLSRFDDLTGIYNRSYFLERFFELQNNSDRYSNNFSLVVFDINNLKHTNDIYGHIIGDKIIKKFTQNTLKYIRKSDIFARWGGDEFVAIFLNISKKEIEMKISELTEILKRESVNSDNKDKIFCHFSSGYAIYPSEANDFDSLLKLADNRMYQCKRKMKEAELKQ